MKDLQENSLKLNDDLSASGGNNIYVLNRGDGARCAVLFGRGKCEAANDFEWRMKA